MLRVRRRGKVASMKNMFGISKYRGSPELVPLLGDHPCDSELHQSPSNTPPNTGPSPATPPTTPRLPSSSNPSADQPPEKKLPPIVKEVAYSGDVNGASVVYFFDDPQFCDVLVNASNGRQFHCSRMFLCMHSATFRTLLAFKDGEQRKSAVDALEVDADALEGALRFLHMGECCVNEANLVPLIKISKVYDIPALEETCRHYQNDCLCLTLENCCLLLEQALASGLLRGAETSQDEFARSDIVWRCERFTAGHLEELLEDDDFLNLSLAAIKGVTTAAANGAKAGSLDQSQYASVIRGVSTWVAKDPGGRNEFADDLIDLLNVDYLSDALIQDVSTMKVVVDNPKLAEGLRKFLRKTGDVGAPALIASLEGISDVVEKVIQCDGWCYIWGVGGLAAHSRGGRDVAEVGGAFYLQKGDVLKLALTSRKSDVWAAAVILTERQGNCGGFTENLLRADLDDEAASCLEATATAEMLLAISLLASQTGSFLNQPVEQILQRRCNMEHSRGPSLKIWATYDPPEIQF
ncbi:hypothetical protein BSKO_13767 [Bryopsis sp. KO-2023]|nr:hypothetical protein BSKO_13767 [Bryopsis sp. KO-2023]